MNIKIFLVKQNLERTKKPYRVGIPKLLFLNYYYIVIVYIVILMVLKVLQTFKYVIFL